MYGELGRTPLRILIVKNILKYWLKIINNRHTLLYYVYSILRADADNGHNYNNMNWAANIKKLLCHLGFANIWFNQDYTSPDFNVF